MAKRHHRLLSALLAALLLSSSAVSASAATVGAAGSGAGSLAKYYSTNGTGVGKEAKITIDGDAGDWDESMKIAQGAAWDVANHWKGGHENCVLDTYALYAAWDDSNLYIGWQMVNTTDTWAREGDGPLSDGGRVLDVPLILALSVDPNSTSMSNKNTDGNPIWGQKMGLEFDTHVDHLFYMSGKPGLGKPSMFTAVDASGNTDYTKGCVAYADGGIEYKLATTNINSQIWGLNGSDDPMDVCDNNAEWVDYATTSHNTKYDSFYEMKIPFSTIGISKSQLTKNGIGAMLVATRGESALDCIPYDLSMIDNATEDYGADASTSHEKDDVDVITAKLASIGNGTITPPDPISETDKTTDKTTDTTTDTTPDTDTSPDVGGNVLPVEATAKKGDTVTVKLGINEVSNLLGVSAAFKYDTDKLQYVSAKSVYDGVEVNKASDDEIKWNANLGNGSAGVNVKKNTAMVELTFKALKDLDGYCGMTTITDIYDYDFKTTSASQYINVTTGGTISTDTDVDTNEIKVSATAAANDTVAVTFKGDLSAFEGVSSTFSYDSDLLSYVDCEKLDGVQVEVNQTNGLIRWNCINTDGSSAADIVTFNFKARKAVNGVVGTNTIKEIYDANSKDVSPSIIKAAVSVNGKSDTDSDTDVVAEAKKIDVVAKKGDRVTVSFKVSGAKNAAGIQDLVDFDSSALFYNNDAASSVGVINADASNGRVAWSILFDMSSSQPGKDFTNETEIAVMTFTALKDIKASDNVLNYTIVDFYGFDDTTFKASSSATATASIVSRGEGKVDVTAKKGNYVKVYCRAIDAPKALGIDEQLDFDSSALKYIGYENTVGHFDLNTTSSSVRWSEMFDAKGTDLSADSNLAVFTFYAAKDISSSENVLSYTVHEFYDVDLKDFDVSNTTMAYAVTVADAEQGGTTTDTDTNPGGADSDISIGSDTDGGSGDTTVTIIFGDVDNDGMVASGDAVKVLRTSTNLETLTKVEEIAADVNGDGSIDSGDALSVLRYSVKLSDKSKAGQTAKITIEFT